MGVKQQVLYWDIKMKDPRFYVYLIESPSAQDLLESALEGRTLTEALHVSGIDCSYYLAANYQTFDQALGQRLENTLFSDGHRRLPIIHISAHGNPQGMAFTDGTFIAWDALYHRLLNLNERFNGGLIVSVSACFGAYANQLLKPNQRPPFFALVGPTNSIALSDLAIGYAAFYHNIKKFWNIESAFNAMKMASGNHEFQITYGNAQQSYQTVLQGATSAW
ncbi:Hypothetical protein VS_1882 [Vibrio atlanticus]|uniref:Gingipain domain-containing protein n=2 Tax=Vibrionaceae TaxID=641 RepID=B7VPW5_VIBA3|nr:Hypothetical protein VS_1882 [Vibrio atlanticus]